MLQYLQDAPWAFFIYLKQNIEVGLDLATALSIIGAAWVFINKYTKERKDRRNNEIWEYFKKIADDISDIKLEITDEISKRLYFLEMGELITEDEIRNASIKLRQLSKKLIFHIRFNTMVDIQNLLKYYHVKESTEAEILKIATDTNAEIKKCIDELEKKEKLFSSRVHKELEKAKKGELDQDTFVKIYHKYIFIFRGYLGAIISYEEIEDKPQLNTGESAPEIVDEEEQRLPEFVNEHSDKFYRDLYDDKIEHSLVEILNSFNNNLLQKIQHINK